MPDINRFEKIQVTIRLAIEIGARRYGVTTEEAKALMDELVESPVSLRTAQRTLNGLAGAFPGFRKDETSGRWVWRTEDIPPQVLSADPDVWPDLKQAAQIMMDRGDVQAALRIDCLSRYWNVIATALTLGATREKFWNGCFSLPLQVSSMPSNQFRICFKIFSENFRNPMCIFFPMH